MIYKYPALKQRLERFGDMAKVASTHPLPKLRFSAPHHPRLNPTINFPTALFRGASLVRASNPKREQEVFSTNTTSSPSFVSEEDLKFVAKLGGGSIAGAAVIKYGSIVLPEMTRPNLIHALVVVSAPMVVAILLLLKQSLQR